MASSAGSYHTDSDGANHGVRTPTRTDAAAAAASELSPPGSQPQQPHIISTSQNTQAIELDADQGLEQPLAPWKSKRAQDEYDRAMEHVVDKDFNLRL